MTLEELSLRMGGTWKANFKRVPIPKAQFADFPFTHAAVTYNPLLFSTGVEGQFNEIRDCRIRICDSLKFRYHRLSIPHAHMITGTLLENSAEFLITFRAIIPLYKSILAYNQNSDFEHKMDYTRLKSKLVEAHRKSQITVLKDVQPLGTPNAGVSGPSFSAGVASREGRRRIVFQITVRNISGRVWLPRQPHYLRLLSLKRYPP